MFDSVVFFEPGDEAAAAFFFNSVNFPEICFATGDRGGTAEAADCAGCDSSGDVEESSTSFGRSGNGGSGRRDGITAGISGNWKLAETVCCGCLDPEVEEGENGRLKPFQWL